jgi:PAS domain S-box-containing protein
MAKGVGSLTRRGTLGSVVLPAGMAAAVALVLTAVWSAGAGAHVPVVTYVSRGFAFLVVGLLIGRYAAQRRRLEEQLRRAYELSVDLHCRADFRGRFTSVNPAGVALLGYDVSELLSRPFLDFVHPDDRERTLAETARLADSDERTVDFENRYLTAEGRYIWLSWTARAHSRDGVIYATARDVTARRDAHAALEHDLQAARFESLRRLAIVAEYRDDSTHRHTARVGDLSALLAERLGLHPAMVERLRHAAPLHDVGKLGVPDAILLKPGRLTPVEFRAMQEHTTIGATILTGSRFPVLQLGEEIALTHHERWDGRGYPHGLQGEGIPIAGRIVAVADVFDALTHARPYKGAWASGDAVAEIERGAGSQFDPDVAAVFAELWREGVPALRPCQEVAAT